MFAVLSALILITMGGLVTSKEVGLAVPDWPTSFGYNMFLLPLGDEPNPPDAPLVTYGLILVNCAVYLFITVPLSFGHPEWNDPIVQEYLGAWAQNAALGSQSISVGARRR